MVIAMKPIPLGCFVLTALLLANFLIPDSLSRKANIAYSNEALSSIKARTPNRYLNPTSPEARAILDRGTKVSKESFQRSFDVTSLVVGPLAGLMAWLLLRRYIIVVTLVFLLFYSVMFVAGLSGVLGIASFVLGFGIPPLISHARLK